jgi:hypothetical protein
MLTIQKNRCIPASAPEAQSRRLAVLFPGAGRDNFRDNLGDSRVLRNSKPVVYLGFPPR